MGAMARRNPLTQSNYCCHDCRAKVGTHPYRWWLDDKFWIPLCVDCMVTRSDLEMEVLQGNALAAARMVIWETHLMLDARGAR